MIADFMRRATCSWGRYSLPPEILLHLVIVELGNGSYRSSRANDRVLQPQFQQTRDSPCPHTKYKKRAKSCGWNGSLMALGLRNAKKDCQRQVSLYKHHPHTQCTPSLLRKGAAAILRGRKICKSVPRSRTASLYVTREPRFRTPASPKRILELLGRVLTRPCVGVSMRAMSWYVSICIRNYSRKERIQWQALSCSVPHRLVVNNSYRAARGDLKQWH